jgi:hypothetical protein
MFIPWASPKISNNIKKRQSHLKSVVIGYHHSKTAKITKGVISDSSFGTCRAKINLLHDVLSIDGLGAVEGSADLSSSIHHHD